MTEPITRFDMPEPVKELLAVARLNLSFDMLDVYALAIEHGTDWRGLADGICVIGFANRHAAHKPHGKIVQAAEKVWQHVAEAAAPAPVTYPCPQCKAANAFVNQCGCDPNNMPTRPAKLFDPAPAEAVVWIEPNPDADRVEAQAATPAPAPAAEAKTKPAKGNLIDAIMAIDDTWTIPVMTTDRHINRKEQAVMARELFKQLGLKGISVRTPNYSMASTVDVTIPREPHPGWVGFEEWEHRSYSDMPDDVPARAWSKRHYNAEKALEAILLRAFPQHDNRSDSVTDYYDYCWSIH